MRRVICHDCGKQYDYSVDDFCPRCGAFTQPPRKIRIDSTGAVVRTDGINEAYHKESFVHEELHTENRKRKGTPLEQGSAGKTTRRAPSQTVIRQSLPGRDGMPTGGTVPASRKQNKGLAFWIALIFVLLKFLSVLIESLFY